MTNKDKVYLAGSVIFFVASGVIIFHLVKENNVQTATATASEQSNVAKVAGALDVASVPSQGISSPDANLIPSQDASGTSPAPPSQNTAPSDTNSTPKQHGQWQNMPDGSKPFFGQVTVVSGSQITISSRNSTTVKVTISDSTSFSGGTKDNLTSGTKIAGIGTSNSDGSITATKIQINPTMPSGGGFNRDKTSVGQ
jgi:hypothetical protein